MKAFQQLDKSPVDGARKPGIFLLTTTFLEHQTLSVFLTDSKALRKAEQYMEKMLGDGKSKILPKKEKLLKVLQFQKSAT